MQSQQQSSHPLPADVSTFSEQDLNEWFENQFPTGRNPAPILQDQLKYRTSAFKAVGRAPSDGHELGLEVFFSLEKKPALSTGPAVDHRGLTKLSSLTSFRVKWNDLPCSHSNSTSWHNFTTRIKAGRHALDLLEEHLRTGTDAEIGELPQKIRSSSQWTQFLAWKLIPGVQKAQETYGISMPTRVTHISKEDHQRLLAAKECVNFDPSVALPEQIDPYDTLGMSGESNPLPQILAHGGAPPAYGGRSFAQSQILASSAMQESTERGSATGPSGLRVLRPPSTSLPSSEAMQSSTPVPSAHFEIYGAPVYAQPESLPGLDIHTQAEFAIYALPVLPEGSRFSQLFSSDGSPLTANRQSVSSLQSSQSNPYSAYQHPSPTEPEQ